MYRLVEIKGSQNFGASPQAVWDALHNADLLQKAIPGAEEVRWENNSLFARVNVGIGPVKGTYAARAEVAESDAPRRMRLTINRQGASNSVQGEAAIDLIPNGTGTTVDYTAVANLGGPIAALDNPLTRPMIDKGLSQFFANLAQQVG